MMKKQLFTEIILSAFIITACGTAGQDAPDMGNPTEAVSDNVSEADGAEVVSGSVADKTEEKEDQAEVKAEEISKDSIIPVNVSYDWDDEWDEETYEYLFNSSYPIYEAEDTETAGEAAPALFEALESVNTKEKEWVQDFKSEYEAVKENAEADAPDLRYELDINGSIVRCDGRVLSIRDDWTCNTGGAHGDFGIRAYNYDTQTGKELKLDDVFTDRDKLSLILEEKLLENYDKEIFFYYTGAEGRALCDYVADAFDGDMEFNLSYDRVTFCFATYSLAPYASGLQMADIRYDEYPELFKMDLSSPAEHGELVRYGQFYDVNTENGLKHYSFDGYQDTDEENYVECYELTVYDGKEPVLVKRFDEYNSYSGTPYIVFLKDRVMLLVEVSGDNDSSTTYAADLSKKDISFELVGDGGFTIGSTQPSDPGHFSMWKRCDVLSTYSVKGYFYFDEEGNILPSKEQEEYYDVNAEFPEPLKLLKDTAFDVVDENGEFVRERLFKAGAEFKIIKSDAKRKVLLETEDGMIVRVVIDNEEWPLTINGEDAFEIFDNMFFAG